MRTRRVFWPLVVVTVACFSALPTAPTNPVRGADEQQREAAGVPRTRVSVPQSSAQVINCRVTLSPVSIREVTTRGRTYHRIDFDGAERLSQRERFDLPVIRRWFAIPECRTLEIDLAVHSEYSRTEIDPLIFRTGDAAGTPLDPSVPPSRSGQLPGEVVQLVKTCHLRGQFLALIEIRPVQYIPSKRELRVISDFEFNLRPVDVRGELFASSGPMRRLLPSLITNGGGFEGALAGLRGDSPQRSAGGGAFKWCQGATWQATADTVNNFGADYLMIVADELAQDAADSSLVESLANRRATYNGFNVAIARMAGIDATPDTAVTPITIRDFIKM